MGSSIPLNPSASAADGGLLDLSLVEVVSLFIDKEKRRAKEAKDDENQAEVVVTARSSPLGLMAMLNLVSHRLGVSRSLLTRCLSHQIIVWYDSIPSIREVTEKFYDGYEQALGNGLPDLCERLQRVRYPFNSSDESIASYRSIRWVQSRLEELSLPVGLPAGVLFVIGLCYSASAGKDFQKTRSNFREEVDRFGLFVGERLIEVRRFHETVQYRIENLKT